MSDDVREYLRAAQAAELRGDTSKAVELLEKAASVYRTSGRQSRAIQMLRHAYRLDGSRADLLEEIHRLELLPDVPTLSRAAEVMSESLSLESERALEAEASSLEIVAVGERGETLFDLPEETAPALSAFEVPRRGRSEVLVERGPRWAADDADAWCSFCCRPGSEVGRLVAGAAGAFICEACARFPSGDSAPTSARPAVDPAELAAIRFVGDPIRELLPLITPESRVLILGGEGSGKSTLLRELAGGRAIVRSPLPRAASEPLFIDEGEALSAADLEWLSAQKDRSWVIAYRGEPPRPAVSLSREDLRLAIFTSESLVAATGAALPLALAERAQLTLALPTPDAALLRKVAESHVQGPREDALLTAIAEHAASSPRKGHELAALLGRIPTGAWALTGGRQRRPPTRRRKKGGSSS